jgi:sortase (surface protein transpeptidase)
VRTRPIPAGASRSNRIAAALAIAGIGLVATGFAGAFDGGGDLRLDTRSQEQRALPVPGPDAVTEALARAPRPSPYPSHAPTPPEVRKQLPRPVRIIVPAIGVNAPVIPLGRNPDHTVQVPSTFTDTGWFEPGPEPGEIGSALIVGHVDSYKGPGVFYRLPALRRGDRITVVIASGRRLRFVVTSSRDVSKLRFPSELVYRRTRRSTLRLVTCGGLFDPSTHHYLSNHIVFAWLIGRP